MFLVGFSTHFVFLFFFWFFVSHQLLFFDFFLLSGTIVLHSSKPTRGEAYELLVLDAENTVIPLFFVLINLAQSLNPNYLTENILLKTAIPKVARFSTVRCLKAQNT